MSPVQIIATLLMILVVHIQVITHRAVMTADLHLVRVGIDMKNINHLTPLYNFYKRPWLCTSRRAGFKFLVFKLCTQLIPELECDFFADFPFIPKRIPKVKNRKVRRACYQSFRLYKNSFKPIRYPRLRIIMDEYPRSKSDDQIDSISHAFLNKNFYSKFHMLWGVDSESRFFRGNIQNDQ